jgi:hypothetical protein
MVEYGNGVGEVAGRSGGGHGPSADVGASLSRMVGDAAHAISTAPPEMLLAGAVILFLGLLVLRRAFF